MKTEDILYPMNLSVNTVEKDYNAIDAALPPVEVHTVQQPLCNLCVQQPLCNQ